MKTTVWCVLVAAFSFQAMTPLASAASCGDTFVEGQELEKDGKLRAARDRYLSCAAETCGKNLPKECRERYEAILPRIPTVTLEAFRGETQLTAFEVTVDGEPLKFTGAAIELDPGTHVFVFTADGKSIKQQFLVVESKKGQSIKAVFPSPTASPVAAKTEAKPETKSEVNEGPVEGSYRGPLGLVVGGLGVVGMGVGVALGLSAKSMANSADCQGTICATQAAADQRHTAVSRAGLATIVFGVGALVGAGGVVLWLTAPSKGDRRPQMGLRLGPSSLHVDLRF